ncbi:MAG TPA: phage holin family protein [Myxococcaceae bacterium]|nr:phage holin family protein [Myxococcaceae bacterium]
MRSPKKDADGSLSPLITKLADGLGRLLSEHLELARLELKGDAKALATVGARLAVALPFALVGYAFLCAALCLALSHWLILEAVVAVVGALNLLAGGVLAYAAVRGLKRQNVMDKTLQELSKSVAVLAPDGHPRLPEIRREQRQ